MIRFSSFKSMIRFLIMFTGCFIFQSGFSQCPDCNTANNFPVSAQAPKAWMEMLQNPNNIDRQYYEYSNSIALELAISATGEITKYTNLLPASFDTAFADSLIKLSPRWTPATICQVKIASKRIVFISINPIPIRLVERYWNCSPSRIPVEYPGGYLALKRWIYRNIQPKITVPVNELESYCTIAIYKIIIDKTGNVISWEILNKKQLHPSQIAAVDTLFKKSHKWKPAYFYGRNIQAEFINIINFQILCSEQFV